MRVRDQPNNYVIKPFKKFILESLLKEDNQGSFCHVKVIAKAPTHFMQNSDF